MIRLRKVEVQFRLCSCRSGSVLVTKNTPTGGPTQTERVKYDPLHGFQDKACPGCGAASPPVIGACFAKEWLILVDGDGNNSPSHLFLPRLKCAHCENLFEPTRDLVGVLNRCPKRGCSHAVASAAQLRKTLGLPGGPADPDPGSESQQEADDSVAQMETGPVQEDEPQASASRNKLREKYADLEYATGEDGGSEPRDAASAGEVIKLSEHLAFTHGSQRDVQEALAKLIAALVSARQELHQCPKCAHPLGRVLLCPFCAAKQNRNAGDVVFPPAPPVAPPSTGRPASSSGKTKKSDLPLGTALSEKVTWVWVLHKIDAGRQGRRGTQNPKG